MSTLEILEEANDLFGTSDDTITFERIRHHRDGRMPVGRAAAANRSSRRQDRWRNCGRNPAVSRFQ
jgi:hypothetical protein